MCKAPPKALGIRTVNKTDKNPHPQMNNGTGVLHNYGKTRSVPVLCEFLQFERAGPASTSSQGRGSGADRAGGRRSAPERYKAITR